MDSSYYLNIYHTEKLIVGMCPFKDPKKQREWRRMYYQQHQEEACEYTRRYRQQHLEKVREKDRQFGKQHRKAISTRVKEWRARNPEKDKEHRKRYYQRHREQATFKINRLSSTTSGSKESTEVSWLPCTT